MAGQEKIREMFEKASALVFNSHLVYTSGRHGSAYVNKDALYPDTDVISKLCEEMADLVRPWNPEVVVGPALGGIILSQWLAHHLSRKMGKKIPGVYAEKDPATDSFVLRRGYDSLVKGKKAVVVEDVLTTGGSVKKLVDVIRQLGGEVLGVAALCNRGQVTNEQLGQVPKLAALLDLKFETYDPKTCPLCQQGIPINQQLGKGTKS